MEGLSEAIVGWGDPFSFSDIRDSAFSVDLPDDLGFRTAWLFIAGLPTCFFTGFGLGLRGRHLLPEQGTGFRFGFG